MLIKSFALKLLDLKKSSSVVLIFPILMLFANGKITASTNYNQQFQKLKNDQQAHNTITTIPGIKLTHNQGRESKQIGSPKRTGGYFEGPPFDGDNNLSPRIDHSPNTPANYEKTNSWFSSRCQSNSPRNSHL